MHSANDTGLLNNCSADRNYDRSDCKLSCRFQVHSLMESTSASLDSAVNGIGQNLHKIEVFFNTPTTWLLNATQ